MAEQLSFDLPVRSALGRGDFFVSEANALALAMVDQWPDWPAGKLLITGPARSGKTHLAHLWADTSHARIVDATDLTETMVPELAAGHVCVENACTLPRGSEPALFHLHNLTLAEGYSLLLTARKPASLWPVSLPDLASRMQGTQSVALAPPDDALLRAILIKLFADRQMVPPAGIVEFLLPRMPRDMASAAQIVERLDRLALSRKTKITRPLAKQVLEEFDG